MTSTVIRPVNSALLCSDYRCLWLVVFPQSIWTSVCFFPHSITVCIPPCQSAVCQASVAHPSFSSRCLCLAPVAIVLALSGFRLSALGSVKRLETIVLLWRYINRIELNWIELCSCSNCSRLWWAERTPGVTLRLCREPTASQGSCSACGTSSACS